MSGVAGMMRQVPQKTQKNKVNMVFGVEDSLYNEALAESKEQTIYVRLAADLSILFSAVLTIN